MSAAVPLPAKGNRKPTNKQKSTDGESKEVGAANTECVYFTKNGRCKNGSNCKFAHNPSSASSAATETSSVLSSPRVAGSIRNERKTVPRSVKPTPPQAATAEVTDAAAVTKQSAICTFFLKSGRCKNGSNCRFSHSFNAEPQLAAPVNQEVHPAIGDGSQSNAPADAVTPSLSTVDASPVKGIRVSSAMTNLLKNFVGLSTSHVEVAVEIPSSSAEMTSEENATEPAPLLQQEKGQNVENPISPNSGSQSRLLSMLLGLEAKRSGKPPQTPTRVESTENGSESVSNPSEVLMTPPGFSASVDTNPSNSTAEPTVSHADHREIVVISPVIPSTQLPLVNNDVSDSTNANAATMMGLSPGRQPHPSIEADSFQPHFPTQSTHFQPTIQQQQHQLQQPVHHPQSVAQMQYFSSGYPAMPPSYFLQHSPYSVPPAYMMHQNMGLHPLMAPPMYGGGSNFVGSGLGMGMDMQSGSHGLNNMMGGVAMFPHASMPQIPQENWNNGLTTQQLNPPRVDVGNIPGFAQGAYGFPGPEALSNVHHKLPSHHLPYLPENRADHNIPNNPSISFPPMGRGLQHGAIGSNDKLPLRGELPMEFDSQRFQQASVGAVGSRPVSQSTSRVDNNSLLRAALGMNNAGNHLSNEGRRINESSTFFEAGNRNRIQSVDSEMSFNHDSIVESAISRSTDHTPSHDVINTSSEYANDKAVTAPTSIIHKVSRTTRNQPGVLSVFLARGKGQSNIKCETDNFSVRPATHLMVRWQLPAHIFENKMNDSLVIGLLRYGSLGNQPAVVAKQIGPVSSNMKSKDVFGNIIVSGNMPFHAPKGSGRFVFRMFNNSTDRASNAITLATSLSFSVELVDIDVTSNFRFSLDAFQDKQNQKAVQQLTCTVMAVRNGGKPLKGEDPRTLLNENMRHALHLVDEVSATVDAARERASAKKEALEASNGADEDLDESNKAEEEKYWSSARLAHRMQSDLMEFFMESVNNRIVWNMLSDSFKEVLHTKLNLFCPILTRFFTAEDALLNARMKELGFLPARTLRLSEMPNSAFSTLDRLIAMKAPELYPAATFESSREAVKNRLEKLINDNHVFPEGMKLNLYGSSCNMFGVDSADLDMCMSFPHGVVIPADSRAALLDTLSKVLSAHGFLEVAARSTARIPIVNFKDPESGLDCDISYYNPLAICNTQLLRSYCNCDFRVRPLAYIIKKWAKQRKINAPGEGTLGSYGYILCLIHYLQTRKIPVVPYLQRLPKTWRGEDLTMLHEDPAFAEHEIELHPVDNSPCKTYFYHVTEENSRIAKAFGSRNSDSIGKILLGFFQYFAWEFDYKHSVVSTIHTPQTISKMAKGEWDCWTQHDRLSIEDPFETWYDVAHVIKGPQMSLIRKEFLRAYTIMSRFVSGEGLHDIPTSQRFESVLDLLFDAAENPGFARRERGESLAVDASVLE